MTDHIHETLQYERGRLRFRAWHRGTREMDLLLGSFADANIASWNAAQLAEFSQVLNEIDVDLYDWYIGRMMPSSTLDSNTIFKQFQAHKFASV